MEIVRLLNLPHLLSCHVASEGGLNPHNADDVLRLAEGLVHVLETRGLEVVRDFLVPTACLNLPH